MISPSQSRESFCGYSQAPERSPFLERERPMLRIILKRVNAANVIAVSMVIAMLAVAAPRVEAQAAPALTEVRCLGVASPHYRNGSAWDNVPSGAIATTNNHGGNWIRVAVLERGYGQNSMASFNGTKMTLYKSEAQVGADRRVWGYIRYYQLNVNFTSGSVTAQSTSINFPVRTRTTRLNVR